jgi:putative exporter of polyketide antibiotics
MFSTWGAAASQAIALITAIAAAVTSILVIIRRLRGHDGENDNEENN